MINVVYSTSGVKHNAFSVSATSRSGNEFGPRRDSSSQAGVLHLSSSCSFESFYSPSRPLRLDLLLDSHKNIKIIPGRLALVCTKNNCKICHKYECCIEEMSRVTYCKNFRLVRHIVMALYDDWATEKYAGETRLR